MAAGTLLLRWSWRDLRHRWLLVTAIALVIALGTGLFAALQSMTAWRRASNDASFAALAMHDLEVELGTGQFVDAGAILAAVRATEAGQHVADAQERLLVPTQVDASTADETILVSGELVGLTTPPSVDRVHVFDGEGLHEGAVLDINFARVYDLPATGTVRVRGGQPLAYTGLGTAPEYVYITGGEQGGLFAQAQYAVLFAPLATVQELSGHAGQVNDLVLTLRPDTDVDAVAASLEADLDAALPVSVDVTTRDDDAVYATLYEDIGNDQKVMTIMAVLVLAGAAFAAFNLTTRIVEAERREIGIGMALGAPPRRIAVRPLLVGVQIALLGAIAGLGLGFLAAKALAGVLEDFVALPIWVTTLDPVVFLQAALLGIALPVLATALPVWRAVRVEPVEAIRTGYLGARNTGYRIGRRLRIPVERSYWEMPLRNILRTPRRTVLTALGIGAAMTSLVAILGMLDTFLGTVDENSAELTRTAESRLVVTLDTFQPVASPVVTAIASDPAVGRAEPGLQLSGTLLHDEPIVLGIDLIDLDGAMWSPTLVETAERPGPGIVLSRKAAEDLEVRAGDLVTLSHPRFDPATGTVDTVATELAVTAIHPSAFRFQAYMDLADASVFGLAGAVNRVAVLPAPGATQADVQGALFPLEGVGAVQPVGQVAELLEDFLGEFVGVFQVIELVVLLLALLIAFNSSSITVDERAREHATMFAFGLRLRTVLSMITLESLVTGLLGTLFGVAAGYGILVWIVEVLLPTTLPDVGLLPEISAGTITTAAVLGIVAVGVAPLFTVRRLRRMDVPSTLRVME